MCLCFYDTSKNCPFVFPCLSLRKQRAIQELFIIIIIIIIIIVAFIIIIIIIIIIITIIITFIIVTVALTRTINWLKYLLLCFLLLYIVCTLWILLVQEIKF